MSHRNFEQTSFDIYSNNYHFCNGHFSYNCWFYEISTDFSTYGLFNIAPITDFSVGNNCYNKQTNVFHVWGGRKQLEWDFFNNRFEYKYYDASTNKNNKWEIFLL